MFERTRVERWAELEAGAAAHDVPGDRELADDLFDETHRSDDTNIAFVNGFLAGDAEDPAEVVDVAMGVDDRGNRAFAQVAIGHVERYGCGRGVGQWVDDQPTAIGAGHEGDVGNVVATYLPHTVGDLEETVGRIQPSLSP